MLAPVCRPTGKTEGAVGHRFDLPEVTFWPSAIEPAVETGHAVAMRTTLKSLLSPLNLAGVLAWIAIGWELLAVDSVIPVWRTAPAPDAILFALHGLFLLAFLWPGKNRMLVMIQLAAAIGLMLLSRSSSLPILLIIVMAQVVQLWPVRTAIVLFLAVNASVCAIFAFVWQYGSPVITSLMYMSFQGFAAITSWYAYSAERTRDELAAINAELLGTRSLLDASVRDSERLRISRELHDVAGHKLTALKLNLRAMQSRADFTDSQELAIAAGLADELLQDIRAVVQQLRLHDTPPLREALLALAEPFPQLSLTLRLDESAARISVIEAEAVLRCVQEALTNTARHSDAGTLSVGLERRDGEWQLQIHDDGNADPVTRQGGGLRGMRERLEALGGTLQWSAVKGMPLTAKWPVRE
jgi:signal transduction histidine kinase